MRIRINGQKHWLYAAVEPDTNGIIHCQLFLTTTTALTEWLRRELTQKHNVEDSVFLVDYANYLKAALRRVGLRFQSLNYGNRNSVERVFREVKRRTSSFSNSFSHVDLSTAESWL